MGTDDLPEVALQDPDEAPDDPNDGTDDDDPALEAIDEDDGTPEDGVPSLIRDEEAQPISGPF